MGTGKGMTVENLCFECQSALFPNGEIITWVNVCDELPDADLEVLVFDLEKQCYVGYFDGENWLHQNAAELLGITHWAEMPRGPQ